jgi:hypothetical protein
MTTEHKRHASPLKQRIQTLVQWFWRFTQRQKRDFLSSFSTHGAVWIETGTFRGDTTLVLSRHAAMVHTIEPQPVIHTAACQRFEQVANIKCHLGESERMLPCVISEILREHATSQVPVRIFLDGHDSGGQTYSGKISTPVRQELEIIKTTLHHWLDLMIFIDDARLFKGPPSDYPSEAEVLTWAKTMNLSMRKDHDMYILARERA